MPSPPCQGLPKHPRRWLQRWLGDTHQSANHNAGELWSHRWQKMRENQQCFGPKKLRWPVQHYLYSLFDLKQRIYKKKNKRLTRKHLSPQFFYVSKLAFPDLKGVAQGWPEDREPRDSHRISDLESSDANPSMVGTTTSISE